MQKNALVFALFAAWFLGCNDNNLDRGSGTDDDLTDLSELRIHGSAWSG